MPDALNIHITGEKVNITNVKFTNNVSAPATPDPTPAPSDDKKGETTTVAVVASKKKVTE